MTFTDLSNAILTLGAAYDDTHIQKALKTSSQYPFTVNPMVTHIYYLVFRANLGFVYCLIRPPKHVLESSDDYLNYIKEISSVYDSNQFKAISSMGLALSKLADEYLPKYFREYHGYEYIKKVSELVAYTASNAFWTQNDNFALQMAEGLMKGDISTELASLITFISYVGGSEEGLVEDIRTILSDDKRLALAIIKRCIENLEISESMERGAEMSDLLHIPINWAKSNPNLGIYVPDY